MKNKLEVIESILKSSSSKFQFIGNKAVTKLPNGNIGEVCLARSGTVGKYNGLLVTIINKEAGEVTRNNFSFEQYLGGSASRHHPNANQVSEMHVWGSGRNTGLDWYIVKPTSFNPINKAISDFLEVYGE